MQQSKRHRNKTRKYDMTTPRLVHFIKYKCNMDWINVTWPQLFIIIIILYRYKFFV